MITTSPSDTRGPTVKLQIVPSDFLSDHVDVTQCAILYAVHDPYNSLNMHPFWGTNIERHVQYLSVQRLPGYVLYPLPSGMRLRLTEHSLEYILNQNEQVEQVAALASGMRNLQVVVDDNSEGREDIITSLVSGLASLATEQRQS